MESWVRSWQKRTRSRLTSYLVIIGLSIVVVADDDAEEVDDDLQPERCTTTCRTSPSRPSNGHR